jgi:hypothetical protein
MFENDVFDTWLDAKSKEIILKLDKEKLSSEEMIILMLKAQTNHFTHLDQDLRKDMQAMNERLSNEMFELRKDMDKRFEQVDKRFEALTTRIDRFMIWSFATTLAIGAGVVAAIRYLPAVS